MIMSCFSAMAQTVDSGKGGNATITIENASKGETYTVVKLFDATVTGKEDGSIAYTGTIPDELSAYFQADTAGNISAVETTLSEEAITAMTTWAKAQTATATAESNGSTLVFTGLPYGYYVIISSQGAAITVHSTNPNAVVYDKNQKDTSLTKDVNDADVDIGQNVIYTVKAVTVNYEGVGEDAKQVVRYDIVDNLPDFLSEVKVTKITIDGAEYLVDGNVPQFDSNKTISIPWVDTANNSLYKNGAEVVITYTAKVTDKAIIAGAGNTNVVQLKPYLENPEKPEEPTPSDKVKQDQETIFTYATALQKIDENGNPLAGAQFAINGLTVTGSNGYYMVVSYDSTSTTPGTEMKCDDNGLLIIEGLNSDAVLTVSETVAPNGYNKLTTTVELKPVKMTEEVVTEQTTTYYDAEGNVVTEESSASKTVITVNTHVDLEAAAVKVENKKGTTLPETGGMGTTILYVGGGILVLAAIVLLIVKRRAAAE